jgi:methyltransferase (TIGR00027 family)
VRIDTPSATAEGTLVFRAVEAGRAAGQRICYDPVAHHFLTPRLTVIGRTWIPEPVARWLYNQAFPGMQGYIVARTRYFDDYFQHALENGVEQVGIVGAGYDSRAYRFEQLMARATVFEVDHPATQQQKTHRVKDAFGGLPKNVVYVPIDFATERMEQCLIANGYDPHRKTLFLWEGVTYYITAEAVDQTLAFVANYSAPGSSLIFDYTLPSVIDGTCPRREARFWRKTVIPRGEPLLFGIEPERIESFLDQRGFCKVTNVMSSVLKEAYFAGANRRRKITPIFGIVHATVASRGTT